MCSALVQGSAGDVIQRKLLLCLEGELQIREGLRPHVSFVELVSNALHPSREARTKISKSRRLKCRDRRSCWMSAQLPYCGPASLGAREFCGRIAFCAGLDVHASMPSLPKCERARWSCFARALRPSFCMPSSPGYRPIFLTCSSATLRAPL